MKPVNIKLVFVFLSVVFAFIYFGCDDSGIVEEKTTDTTMVNYDSLILYERTSPFDSAYCSVDFLKGQVLMDLSTLKDAVLVDFLDSMNVQYFYLRSGDLSIDALGYQTKFKQYVYPNFTRQQFDTLSVIPDSDTTLTESDFESDRTPSFYPPLTNHPVYGFFLKGKSTITPKPVFGVVYFESTWTGGPNNDLRLRISVKINTGGKNSFKVIK